MAKCQGTNMAALLLVLLAQATAQLSSLPVDASTPLPYITPSPTILVDAAFPLWSSIIIGVSCGAAVLFALIWWCLVCLSVCRKRIQRKKRSPPAAEASEEFQWEGTDDNIPILKDNLQNGQDSGEPKKESIEQDQEIPLKEIHHEERKPQEQETALVELESDAEGDEVLLCGVATGTSQEKPKKYRPARLSIDSSEDNMQADDTTQKDMEIRSLPLTEAQLGALLQDLPALDTQYFSIPFNKPSFLDLPSGTELKNRYRDVLPNPHSRVKLSTISGKENSNYINANYMHGYQDTPNSYIAAQGPIPSTVNDFWRMIWEHNCSAIIMTTGLQEKGRVKCAQYWPERHDDSEFGQVQEVYGDLEVRLLKRKKTRSYTVSTFSLVEMKTQRSRKVVHYWFTAWPDHGVPDSTGPLIDFILETRNTPRQTDGSSGPLLVHCSAGIGRTGVFIGADIGMRELEEWNRVDVLKIFSSMRQDRGGMVQTKDQYVLLHKILYDYGKRIGLPEPHSQQGLPSKDSTLI